MQFIHVAHTVGGTEDTDKIALELFLKELKEVLSAVERTLIDRSN